MLPRSLTAAVKRIDLKAPPQMGQASWSSSNDSDWQAEAWKMYREVGELQSVCRWMGASAARVTLYAAEVDDETGRADTPSDNANAVKIVSDIAGGAVGQSDMLRQAAILLTVVGEYYIGVLVDETGEERWATIAADRVKTGMDGRYEIREHTDWRPINPETESIFRVWDRDPQNPEQATSSLRAALPVLREIRAMDQVISAAALSRVAGNGILMIPSEVNIPDGNAPSAGDVPGVPPSSRIRSTDSANTLSRTLTAIMKKAIDKPGSSASVAPLVLTAPKDTIDGFKHLRLDTDLTEQALKTRERAIHRLALSLDIPPEVLTGLGDSTHWNAELVDESALRQHIAPMMSIICEAMTRAVLEPMMGESDAGTEIIVAFDMSSLTQKQDKSESALAAFSSGAISVQALRRELGFSEDDSPSELQGSEYQRQLAEKMVTRAPSLFPYLSEVLGFGPVDPALMPSATTGGGS